MNPALAIAPAVAAAAYLLTLRRMTLQAFLWTLVLVFVGTGLTLLPVAAWPYGAVTLGGAGLVAIIATAHRTYHQRRKKQLQRFCNVLRQAADYIRPLADLPPDARWEGEGSWRYVDTLVHSCGRRSLTAEYGRVASWCAQRYAWGDAADALEALADEASVSDIKLRANIPPTWEAFQATCHGHEFDRR